ncbi:hypothetical protein MRB53_020772 [Persea americana]|uniref:Uncharacterized protein n=1 Tax=Persea americana TaxID=3435 RepID=A0ACC2L222_PERAE|nr:hypothetical protein MRB53_020772 [Persea americana]
MKKANTRPTKRGRLSSTSTSRPQVSSPQSSSSPSTPHLSNLLKPNGKILESLQNRSIVVERRVLVNQIRNFDLPKVVARVDYPPLAHKPASPPPPPPRASSSRPSSSPRPSSSSSTLDRLGAIERDVACIKKEQKKTKKTMNTTFKYYSAICKSCTREDVAAPPSPSSPPPDSD